MISQMYTGIYFHSTNTFFFPETYIFMIHIIHYVKVLHQHLQTAIKTCVLEGDGRMLCYGIKSVVQSVKLIDISNFTL